MVRQILCRKCAVRPGYEPREDRAMGWKTRDVWISCEVPVNHGIKVNGIFNPISDIHCGACNEVITGQIAVARTEWRGGPPPGCWEIGYGRILPAPAVALNDKLTK